MNVGKGFMRKKVYGKSMKDIEEVGGTNKQSILHTYMKLSRKIHNQLKRPWSRHWSTIAITLTSVCGSIICYSKYPSKKSLLNFRNPMQTACKGEKTG